MNHLARLLGEQVKQQRREQGISQEALAQMCGFDRSYMSRIERGVVRITMEKVYILALTLECGLDQLLPALNTPDLLNE